MAAAATITGFAVTADVLAPGDETVVAEPASTSGGNAERRTGVSPDVVEERKKKGVVSRSESRQKKARAERHDSARKAAKASKAAKAVKARKAVMARKARQSRQVSSDPRDIARAMLPEFGFSISQFSCLDLLYVSESNWRVHADNPSSSAYGIPQALTRTHDLPAGYMTSAKVQIRWGLDYIKGRYGTPCAAWSFKSANNWY